MFDSLFVVGIDKRSTKKPFAHIVFMSIQTGPVEKLTTCCRLTSDFGYLIDVPDDDIFKEFIGDWRWPKRWLEGNQPPCSAYQLVILSVENTNSGHTPRPEKSKASTSSQNGSSRMALGAPKHCAPPKQHTM